MIQAAVSLFLISMIVFVLSRLSGDVTALYMPPDATREDWARISHALGLDKPLYLQYVVFLKNALTGNFGDSFLYRVPALSLVWQRFPATLQLSAAGMAIALLGIPLGMLAAVRRGGLVDMVVRTLAVAGQAMPAFWMGLLFILVFAVQLGLLPAAGKGGIQHLILPAIVIGHYPLAALLRLTRSAMLDVLDSDYIKMTRIKGVPEKYVVIKHAFKNSMLPVITLGSLQFIGLINGAVITETVFAWPGVGRLAVDAVFARDYTVVQALVLLGATLYVLGNLLVDVTYAYLDPRIRLR